MDGGGVNEGEGEQYFPPKRQGGSDCSIWRTAQPPLVGSLPARHIKNNLACL